MRCGGEIACDPLLLAIVANNLRACQHLAVTFHCCEHTGDEGIIQFQVAVEDENPLTGCGGNTGVHSLTETAVDGAANHSHALKLGERGRRNVIRDDDFNIGGVDSLLSAQSVNNGKNRFRLAVERNNRRYAGMEGHVLQSFLSERDNSNHRDGGRYRL